MTLLRKILIEQKKIDVKINPENLKIGNIYYFNMRFKGKLITIGKLTYRGKYEDLNNREKLNLADYGYKNIKKMSSKFMFKDEKGKIKPFGEKGDFMLKDLSNIEFLNNDESKESKESKEENLKSIENKINDSRKYCKTNNKNSRGDCAIVSLTLLEKMPLLKKILESYKPKKFYHTSGFKYKHGDIIGGPGNKVFLHDNYLPHWTIIDIVKYGFRNYKEYIDNYSKLMQSDLLIRDLNFKNPKFKKTWVYEVKPFNIKNVKYKNINQEYVTEEFVEVIRNVGSAFGILTKYFNKEKKKYQ